MSKRNLFMVCIAILTFGLLFSEPATDKTNHKVGAWVCHNVSVTNNGEGLFTIVASGGAAYWRIVDFSGAQVIEPQTSSTFTKVGLGAGDYQVQAADGKNGPWTQSGCTFNIPEPPVKHDYSYSVSVTTACEPPTYKIAISGPEVVAQELTGSLGKEVQTVQFVVKFTDGTSKSDSTKVPAYDSETCGGTTTTTHDKPKDNTPGMIYCEWSTPFEKDYAPKFWIFWNAGDGSFVNVVNTATYAKLGENGPEFGRADLKQNVARTITFYGFAHKLLGGVFSIWIEGSGFYTTFEVKSNTAVFPRDSFGWDLTGKCQSTSTNSGGSGAGKVNLLPANPKYAAIRLLVARVTANDDPGLDLYTNGFKIIDAYVLANGKRVENLSFTDSKFYTGWKTGYYTYLPAFGEKAKIVVKFADGTKTFTVEQPIEVVDPKDVHAGNSLMRANFVGNNEDGSVAMKWFPGNSVEELYRRSGFDGTLAEFKKLWNEANPSHSGLERVLPKSILDLCGSTPATWFQ